MPAVRSTRAIFRSFRSTRCGRTARRSRVGSSCRRDPGSTSLTSTSGAFRTGTKFWKEFAWGGRKVETRMIWKVREDEWVFATYAWNEDQTDAVLVPESGSLQRR